MGVFCAFSLLSVGDLPTLSGAFSNSPLSSNFLRRVRTLHCFCKSCFQVHTECPREILQYTKQHSCVNTWFVSWPITHLLPVCDLLFIMLSGMNKIVQSLKQLQVDWNTGSLNRQSGAINAEPYISVNCSCLIFISFHLRYLLLYQWNNEQSLNQIFTYILPKKYYLLSCSLYKYLESHELLLILL